MCSAQAPPEAAVTLRLSVGLLLDRLGACSSSRSLYARFGTDWEAAIDTATPYELLWLFESLCRVAPLSVKVKVHKRQVLGATIAMSIRRVPVPTSAAERRRYDFALQAVRSARNGRWPVTRKEIERLRRPYDTMSRLVRSFYDAVRYLGYSEYSFAHSVTVVGLTRDVFVECDRGRRSVGATHAKFLARFRKIIKPHLILLAEEVGKEQRP